MYIIIEGEVEIQKKTRNAYRTLMVLKEGDVFGEMALVDSKPRSARARAKTDVLLFMMNETVVEQLIHQNTAFAEKLVKILTERLREADRTISELLTRDRENMVVSALFSFAQAKGEKNYKGLMVSVSEFVAWASSSIGLERPEIVTILNTLLKEKRIEKSVAAPNAIIMLDKLDRRYSRKP